MTTNEDKIKALSTERQARINEAVAKEEQECEELKQKLDKIKDIKNICETSCFNIIPECEYPKCNNDKCSIYQALKRIEES